MSGRLFSNGSDVGLFTATKRTTQEEIIWEGTVSLQGASKALKLSRNPSLDTELVLENGFSFGPQNKDEQSHEPNKLIVTFPMKNYDGAIALLKSLSAVNDVATADNYVNFIYDMVLDECDRKRRDFMVLHLTVDAFLLKQTYDKLVSSKSLFQCKNDACSPWTGVHGDTDSKVGDRFGTRLATRHFQFSRHTG